ncbi:ABC transporter substrate-binding protein, partial [Candidatus Micrarchaeota archaeon]|nr:ABC transporter substrate-binding protein [Candidatus Micrarchaeota archaeon]
MGMLIGIAIIAIVAIAAIVMLSISPQPKEETVKIGILTPLTGSLAEYGYNAKRGIELAAGEINKNGGINGKQIQLFFED